LKSADKNTVPTQPDSYTGLLNGFVIVSVVWTVYCNLLVYTGANFHTLVHWCFVPFWAIGGFWYWLRHSNRGQAPQSPEARPIRSCRVPWLVKLIGIAAIPAAYTWIKNYQLCWFIAVGFLVLMMLDEKVTSDPGKNCGKSQMPIAKWIVSLLGLLAIFITLVAHRPDMDDAFYVSIPVSSLEHASLPLLRFDGMFGEPGLPIPSPFYRVTSYELFVGLASFVTRLDPRTLYYIVFPCLFAAFVVIAYWVALRELTGNDAPIGGLILVLVVLLTWGDVHRSYGNFGFVRMFQGKSILVSICIPAAIYYAACFVRQRNVAGWVMLSSVQIAAVGFTSTALVVMPVVAAITLASAWRPNRSDTRMVIVGLSSSMYLIALLVLVATQTLRTGSVVELLGPQNEMGIVDSLTTVLGHGARGYIALLAILAVAALPGTIAQFPGMARLGLATVATVLNPLTSQLVGRLAGGTDADALSWRILWAIPFPLFIVLMGILLAKACRTISRPRLGIGIGVLLAFTFALVPGNWTLSPDNHTQFGLPGYKVGKGYGVAAQVISVTPSNGLVLAPQDVSAWVPLFPKHPRLVGVRNLYLGVIASALGKPEAKLRLMMINCVEGAAQAEESLPAVMEEIQRRGVATVVVPSRLPWQQVFGQKLQAIGYHCQTSGDYIIWTRQLPNRTPVTSPSKA
jgi:hypothetical protein